MLYVFCQTNIEEMIIDWAKALNYRWRKATVGFLLVFAVDERSAWEAMERDGYRRSDFRLVASLKLPIG